MGVSVFVFQGLDTGVHGLQLALELSLLTAVRCRSFAGKGRALGLQLRIAAGQRCMAPSTVSALETTSNR